ncbi:MAG: hypothetical protein LBT83_02675 [Tannerella sp.]|nr:hypothetical protein [Tannerella sp.]
MKKKFDMEKGIITCIVSFFVLSAAFTGCSKNYDYEISALGKKTDSLAQAIQAIQSVQSAIATIQSAIGGIQTTVGGIQTTIGGLKSISTVEPTATGYLLTLSNGESYLINHGTSGTLWTIGPEIPTGTHLDSVWYMNGFKFEPERTAIPRDGLAGAQGESGRTIPGRAPGINEETNCWEFYEWSEEANDYVTRATDINVNGVSYITEKNDTQWSLWLKNLDGEGYREIVLPKTPTAGGGSVGSIGLIGYVSTAAATISLGASIADLSITCWYIDSIYNVTQSEKLTVPWSGRKQVSTGQVLTLLGKSDTALVVTADPPLSSANIQNVVLKNSKGEKSPLVLETPREYTGLLTRSEVPGGPVYLVPFSVDASQTYSNRSSFDNKFRTGAVYYLEDTVRSIKSNYSSFSITTTTGSAAPVASVASVNGAAAVSGVYTVTAGVNDTIGFDNGRYVYDYRIDSIPGGGNNELINIDNANGLFTIQSDTCRLVIRKLHVDGKIYNDTITVAAN